MVRSFPTRRSSDLSNADTRRGARGWKRYVAEDSPTAGRTRSGRDRKSTRLNSSHMSISYADFRAKKKTRVGPLSGELLHEVRCAMQISFAPDISVASYGKGAMPVWYALSLHDALPIYRTRTPVGARVDGRGTSRRTPRPRAARGRG